MFTIEMLPAATGDSLWIEYGTPGDPHRIVIDGGTAGSYRGGLRARILALPEAERRLDLFVITHVDLDHIGGALALIQDDALGVTYGDIWFNGFDQLRKKDELGPKEGDKLADLLVSKGLPFNAAFDGAAVVVPDSGDLPCVELPGDLSLTLLSPSPAQLLALRKEWVEVTGRAGLVDGVEPTPDVEEEDEGPADLLGDEVNVPLLATTKSKLDTAAANGSSIAFVATYEGQSVLFAGDAHSTQILAAIERLAGSGERLAVDAVKLPHHGSKANVSTALLDAVECGRYLFSSGGDVRPDRVAVARVIRHGGERPTLYFNYRTDLTLLWDEKALKKKFKYVTAYPDEGQEGLRIPLEPVEG